MILLLTAAGLACSVRGMELDNVRAGSELGPVATGDVVTLGFWFGFDFYYVSPAVLAERESRTT